MVVYRTPGGGAGEEARRLLSAADRQPQTETPSDTNASVMLGPDRIYRHKSPAAETPRHPGHAGPGPRGAATAVAHLHLRKDQARQGKGQQREDEARARGRDSSR